MKQPTTTLRVQLTKFVAACLLISGLIGLLAALPVTVADTYANEGPGVEQPAGDCGPAWRLVDTPFPGAGTTYLFDIDALSATNLWAVGTFHDNGGLISPLVQYWDGNDWVVSAGSVLTESEISGVSVLSSDDVWVTGTTYGVGPERGLIQHWDGTNWNITPNPYIGSSGSLYAIKAIASDNVWAVGYYNNAGPGTSTLIEHWDGISWTIVSSPSIVGKGNELRDIVAVSENDVWAVGDWYDGQTNSAYPLTQHWDGTIWSIVPQTNPDLEGDLFGVDAASANDVWAVGRSRGTNLLLHWNGNEWTQVLVEPPTSSVSVLWDVNVISSSDAWAVGYYGADSEPYNRTYTMHWDGKVWTHIPSPNPADYINDLQGVTHVSSNDVWAVGYKLGFESGSFRPIVMHYTDTYCTPTPTATGTPPTATSTPTPTTTSTPSLTPEACGANSNFAVASATGVAIVQGTTDIGNNCLNCSTSITLPFAVSLYDRSFTTAHVSSDGIVQFGNSSWVGASCLPNISLDYAIMPYWGSFRTDRGGGIYTRVDGQAPDRVFTIEWRVCRAIGPNNCGGYSNFEVRFAENSSSQQFEFVYGDLESDGAFGSVGVQKGHGSYLTQYSCYLNELLPGTQLTFRLQSCSTTTPTALATTVTSTPVVTSTPTPCGITFTDVSPQDYFYAGVEYLYCRGVVSGYPDNTFRPYSTTTRGQVAKVAALAWGWTLLDPENPTFSDVPKGSTFYQYIETAFSEGIVQGYPDGTFRPGNEVSRGQLSKIVALAAGWDLLDPPTPTYSDVPPGSTFYQYIETATDEGVINGHDDGTFGPANPATRGQIAKIVHLALINH